ncbi:MAG: tRNA (adenosine(37)-N6)-dimethylallyltransferase MiaA, partial [Candidatus Binatia bacterium]
VWELGYGADLPSLQTIGYAQIGAMLQGRCSLEDAISQMAVETRRLAKRQLTWFRAEPEMHWFTPAQSGEIAAAVETFLGESSQ